jgi:hypothetical protein
MNEQFPNDEIRGMERAVVHIWSAQLAPEKNAEFAETLTALLDEVAVKLEGFVEGRVYEGDDGKSITVMTTWKTRHLWADAVWNQRVERVLIPIHGSKTFDVLSYERAVVVSP